VCTLVCSSLEPGNGAVLCCAVPTGRNDAASCCAVQTQGERLKQKIGDIVLKGGDVLLLDTGMFCTGCSWVQVCFAPAAPGSRSFWSCCFLVPCRLLPPCMAALWCLSGTHCSKILKLLPGMHHLCSYGQRGPNAFGQSACASMFLPMPCAQVLCLSLVQLQVLLLSLVWSKNLILNGGTLELRCKSGVMPDSTCMVMQPLCSVVWPLRSKLACF